jgi:hypothetical protein
MIHIMSPKTFISNIYFQANANKFLSMSSCIYQLLLYKTTPQENTQHLQTHLH